MTATELPPDEESLRRIFSGPHYLPTGWRTAMISVGRYKHEKKEAIFQRLLNEGLIGYVHTYGAIVSSIEDRDGTRTLGMSSVYLSEHNTATGDRKEAYKVQDRSAAATWLFMTDPAKGTSLRQFEDQANAVVAASREAAAQARRDHNTSPAGIAEVKISKALGLQYRVDVSTDHAAEGMVFVNLNMISQTRLDHLIMVLQANPFVGDLAADA